MKQQNYNNGQSLTWLLIGLLLTITTARSEAQVLLEEGETGQGIGVTEHLGDTIDLDLIFTDDQGEKFALSEKFGQGKPVVLTLVYYNCPMLCNLILNGLTEGIKEVDFDPGDEYELVTVSFNPNENSELAAAKKKNYLEQLGREGIENGWTFSVSQEENAMRLAEAVGFEYYFDEERGEYNHPSVVIILTADGMISRYLYGIEYSPNDLRLAIVEASEGKSRSTIDRLLLFCYHYDSDARGYVLLAGNIMRIGGFVTLGLVGLLLGIFWRSEGRKGKSALARNRQTV